MTGGVCLSRDMATININDAALRRADEADMLLLLQGLIAVNNSVKPRIEISTVAKIDPSTLAKACGGEGFIGIKRWVILCHRYPWFESIFLKWFSMQRVEIES